MVNKAAIGLLGVVVVASLGVGILVGMQLGGTTDSPTSPAPSTDAATATPTVGQTGNESETTDVPAGDEPRQHTEIPARQFDDEEISTHLAAFVNEERRAQNRSTLSTGDATATSVSAMANEHSVAMADNGSAAHTVEGRTTAKRYENHDLFERCKFKSNEGSYVRQPDETFELIGTTRAGVSYENGGETQFNGNERDVARAIVDGWMRNETYSERLLVAEPTRMGVGVEVTSTGEVYATVDVCS